MYYNQIRDIIHIMSQHCELIPADIAVITYRYVSCSLKYYDKNNIKITNLQTRKKILAKHRLSRL